MKRKTSGCYKRLTLFTSSARHAAKDYVLAMFSLQRLPRTVHCPERNSLIGHYGSHDRLGAIHTNKGEEWLSNYCLFRFLQKSLNGILKKSNPWKTVNDIYCSCLLKKIKTICKDGIINFPETEFSNLFLSLTKTILPKVPFTINEERYVNKRVYIFDSYFYFRILIWILIINSGESVFINSTVKNPTSVTVARSSIPV